MRCFLPFLLTLFDCCADDDWSKFGDVFGGDLREYFAALFFFEEGVFFGVFRVLLLARRDWG